MRFADRMSLLGTETAFEVPGKARALGHRQRCCPLGEPDFDTPRHIISQPRGPGPGLHPLWPLSWSP